MSPTFSSTWRNKWLTADAKTIPDMIRSLRNAAQELEDMLQDGISLDEDGNTQDDYARLITNDPQIAAKYHFEEDECEEDDEDQDDEDDQEDAN